MIIAVVPNAAQCCYNRPVLQYCLDIEHLYVNILYLMTCFLTVHRGDDGQKTYVHDLVSEHDLSVHEGGCVKYIHTESLRQFQTHETDLDNVCHDVFIAMIK